MDILRAAVNRRQVWHIFLLISSSRSKIFFTETLKCHFHKYVLLSQNEIIWIFEFNIEHEQIYTIRLRAPLAPLVFLAFKYYLYASIILRIKKIVKILPIFLFLFTADLRPIRIRFQSWQHTFFNISWWLSLLIRTTFYPWYYFC